MTIEEVNGMPLNEKEVFVGPYVRHQERDEASGISKLNNVHFKKLAENTTCNDLKKVFHAYRTSSNVVEMMDNESNSKCSRFVNFEDAKDTMKAIEA